MIINAHDMSQYIPQSRPKITRQEVEAILTAKGITLGNQCVLLGIRGYYKDSMGAPGRNDQGIYDDALCVISPRLFATFNFNTDPQKHGAKMAMLCPGVYRFAKGKHKNKYDALKAFPIGVSLPCTRDGIVSQCSAINIHKGGLTDTYSAGCQTTPPNEYEEEMHGTIYPEMDHYQQHTILYILIEQ